MSEGTRGDHEKRVTYKTLDSLMEPTVEPIGRPHDETEQSGVEMQTRARRDSTSSNISDFSKDIVPKEEVPLQIGMNILVLLFVLGLTTGVVNGCAQWANKMISLTQSIIIESNDAGWFLFMLTTSAYAAASAFIIKKGNIAATIGSGMPEVKSLLVNDFHHSDFPTIVSFKILVIRLLSLVTAVGSGLSIGIAAPLVHISICIAYTLMNVIPDFGEFLENHAIRKQIFTAAAAVGMTTVFNAPVGGLLLSLELTNTFYLVSNYWRSFMVATTGAVMYSIFLIARSEEGRIFQVTYDANPFLKWEFLLYALLGTTCGLLGLQYLRLHQWYFLFVKPYTIKYPIATAAAAGAATALLIFAAGAHSANGVSESVIVHDTLQDASISTMSSRPNTDPLGALIASLLVRVLLTLMGTTLRISCGVFLPVLTIGALLGRIYGQILSDMFASSVNIYVGGYAMVGAVAFVSGTTHTISVAVIVIEQTGQFSMLLPCLIGAVIACGITKSRSLSLYDQGMVNKGLESFDLLLKESGGFKYAADVMDAKVNAVHARCTIGDLVELLSPGTKQATFPVVSSGGSNRLIGCIDRLDVFAYLKGVFETADLYGYIRYKLPADAHYEDRRLDRLKQIEMRKALFNTQNLENSVQNMLGLQHATKEGFALNHPDKRPVKAEDAGSPRKQFKGWFGMLNARSHGDLHALQGQDDDGSEVDLGSEHSEDSAFGPGTEGVRHAAPVTNPLLFTPTAATAHGDDFAPTGAAGHATLEQEEWLREQRRRQPTSAPAGAPQGHQQEPRTPSSPAESFQNLTEGFVQNVRALQRRVTTLPGGQNNTDANADNTANAFDQARVDALLAREIKLTQEPALQINGFPFTAHRYTTMDQLYVLFEMVKVNVVFVVTNTKRLEGMISKYELMQNLKKKAKNA